ncbi:MAG: hypothetical protein P4L41_10585 [Flavipsychrobacter sp.]|nr:hypothetical protein [Flavipsychrobacter sp.]
MGSPKGWRAMTEEEIFDTLQKKYSDAMRELYDIPEDLHTKRKWQHSLDDMLIYLSNLNAHAIPGNEMVHKTTN